MQFSIKMHSLKKHQPYIKCSRNSIGSCFKMSIFYYMFKLIKIMLSEML